MQLLCTWQHFNQLIKSFLYMVRCVLCVPGEVCINTICAAGGV